MSGRAAAAAPTAAAVGAEALQLEALLTTRAYLYELFHKLLGGAPDAEVLDALLSDAAVDAVDEYASDDETMRGLADFLAGLAAREDRAGLADAVRDEYTRLFVGPGELLALPWESPYRTYEATVFQENTLAVRRAYRAHGWEPKRLQRVPDDHVALMCDFMAKLAGEALAAFRVGDVRGAASRLRGQQAFVVEHMVSWLGACAMAVRRSETAKLYPQLMEALAAFVRIDAVFLAEAAFWIEQHVEEGVAPAAPDTPEAEAFARMNAARARVGSLRPFGIEDCELTKAAN